MSQAPSFELQGESTPVTTLLVETWRSRALLMMLARKDFFVRYRRASFGVLWAIGLPLIQAVVLAAVLSRFVRFNTKVNYTVFIFTGMTVWSFFAGTLTTASTSIVDGQGLSTKIYFPRAILPLVSVASSLYGFVFSLLVVVAMCVVAGVPFGLRVLLVVPAVVLMVALTVAFSLVLSALHVYFRDVRYIVQAAVMAWFYVTPVVYPLSAARNLAPLIRLNPATGMTELFRAAFVGGDPGWVVSLWWTLAWTAGLLAVGALLYRRFDRVFVDLM
jgi:lipopolysaccharide transport system permease protein